MTSFKSIGNRYFLALVAIFMLGCATFVQAQDMVFPEDPIERKELGDGRWMEVYKATVEHVRGNRLTVRYPHGTRYTYVVPADFTFEVDGRSVPVRSLRRGDELRAYVTKHVSNHHEIHHVDPVSLAPSKSVQAEPEADALPATASSLPATGLLGIALLCLGLVGVYFGRRVV